MSFWDGFCMFALSGLFAFACGLVGIMVLRFFTRSRY